MNPSASESPLVIRVGERRGVPDSLGPRIGALQDIVPAAPSGWAAHLMLADEDTPKLSTEHGYQRLFQANPAPMLVYDLDSLRFLAVNDAAVSRYGFTRDEFLTMSIADLRSPRSREHLKSDTSCLTPSHASQSGFARHRRKDGSTLNVEVSGVALMFADCRAELLVVGHASNEFEAGRAPLGSAQELVSLGRWKWYIAENRVVWSDELFEIFGLERQAFEATYEGYLARVHPDDRYLARKNVESTLLTGEPFASDYRVVLPSGDVLWLHSRGRLVRGDDGRPLRMDGVCQNVTSQKVTEEALAALALHDPLTNLANRTLLMDRLEQALRRKSRDGGSVAVLFIDLDRFKAVNDRHGHGTGDELLLAVASRLRQVVRPHDTIARIGGDEFVVVCERLDDAHAPGGIAQRLLSVLAGPVALKDQEVLVSASIGIAFSGEANATPEGLLRDADTAMYQAEEAGRNRFVVFDPAIRARKMRCLRRGEELRAGLERGELRVFYQPEVDLADETPTGVEALVRWQHPSLGLLPPSEFIEVAEDSGLIVALGDWVLKEACREVASRRHIPGQDALTLSVNLSARQLGEGQLIDTVYQLLRETGLEPDRLCFEITESVLMDDVEYAIEALLGLKTLGVRLAIDDFGTGYSSLSYLRRFPVDVVKLDRSFVAGLGTDPAATAIVAATVNLSHALGLSVVAEGVETEEQLVALRALRCDRAQGYYWSRPAPPGELLARPGALRAAPLAVGPVDLYAVLTERVKALRAATGRAIVLQAPPNLAPVFAEPGGLGSVLDQLLGNAVKYSQPDKPVVVSAAGDRRWVRVSVSDFGLGMSAAETSRCFEQFWQAKTPRGFRHQGTGIGLYIVRSLVESMGGRVAVRSAPGKGATFTVALPRSRQVVERARSGTTAASMGEDSSIREFMRQIGSPSRRGA